MAERLTFGLLIHDLRLLSNLDEGYQTTLWKGVVDEARKRDINLITFVGGELESPNRDESIKNIIYDQVDHTCIDGLIVISSTLSSRINDDKMLDFLDRYKGIPLVSTGLQIPGYPGITIDNTVSLVKLMNHMIEDHGYRKIAYLRGTENNPEAVIRYNVFLDAMKSHGIPVDQDIVGCGDFIYSKAYEVVDGWLSENRRFDAIVSANDDMALGAIDAMKKYNMQCPEDIAITGFDNIEMSRYTTVSLTTINQPVYNLGRKSLDILLKHVNGEEVPWNTLVETELIIRKSCGCKSVKSFCTYIPVSERKLNPGELAEKTVLLFANQSDLTSFSKNTNTLQYLAQSFFECCLKTTDNSFVYFFSILLKSSAFNDLQIYARFLDLLRSTIYEQGFNDLTQAENILHISIELLHESEKSQIENRIRNIANLTKKIQHLGRIIQTSFGMNNLINDLSVNIGTIGIYSAQVCIYSGSGTSFSKAKLLLGIDNNNIFYKNAQGHEFPARELYPHAIHEISHYYSMISELLWYQDKAIGYILIELDPDNGIFSAEFAAILAGAIKNALLTQDLIDKDNNLESAYRAIQKSEAELKSAYELLQKNQEQLIASEKMASIGRLTAGLAHEINTPIAAVRAAISKLKALNSEYSQSIGDPEIVDADHIAIANEMTTCLQLAEKSASDAANFVSSLKSQTRNTDNTKEKFNAVDVINRTTVLLIHELRNHNISFQFIHSVKSAYLFGNPDRLSRITANLLTNAIDALESRTDGRITITLTEDKNSVLLDFSDNGCGISTENARRIFDPMFSTKRFSESRGLGLTIARSIITGEFNGSIDVKSEEGKGTVFHIVLSKTP